ncbi:MAG TPA: c-type cytochrome, partial [Verrucomicrobiae bacterium]|nr:c-type cytochrome [Verrucomicrobiae bacterium]
SKSVLSVAADDQMTVYINGRKIGDAVGWDKATVHDVTKDLHEGENLIAIRGTNISGPAAIIAMLEISQPKKEKEFVVTDTNWISTTNEMKGWYSNDFNPVGWTRVVSLGKVGVDPWGDPLSVPKPTPVKDFTVLPGFKAELVRTAEVGEGSWVSMTVDQKGRLIISPQYGKNNILRMTLSRKGQVVKTETIDLPVGSAMGLLYAFDSLYVNGDGPQGIGLYRLHYNPRTDRFDSVKLLRNIEGGAGEHGTHAVVLGPDKHIYIVSGNFTKQPKDLSPQSPHQHYADDQLLPPAQDGNGFGVGIKPPGGSLWRMDRNGQHIELFAAGMRNTYDFAFNPDGEIFGFDSDMEWDWGMPWYRPIRVCHLVSGGDYGFREGSGKWPKYYPDSLPSTVDVGIGSPTGLKFGTASNFPEKYKKALFMLDWSYGRVLAVHLTPKGASYDATFETILRGKPLNLTDIEFGKDGAMYFITGGRNTASGLYRVTYIGPKLKPEPGPSRKELKAAARARELRHELEAFHGKRNRKAVDFAWPYLNSDDRFIRYAARIAIESQPVEEWKVRALFETRTNAALTALLALARCGDGPETQNALLHQLARFPLNALTEEQKLDKLRVIEVSFIRQGRPEAQLVELAIEKLDQYYPAKDRALNRELCELLVYLQAPDVVEKTLALMDAAPTQEEQLWYVVQLRNLKSGWTLKQREHYLQWFAQIQKSEDEEDDASEAAKKTGYYEWSKKDKDRAQYSPDLLKWFNAVDHGYGNGASFPKFIDNFRSDAIATLTDEEKKKLGPLAAEKKKDPYAVPSNRKFVQDWTMSDLQPLLNELSKGRSFAKGREVFREAQCIECHRFGNKGGAVGPELTAISSRFSHRDILESIIDPSKVISEQYQNMIVIKKNGDSVVGRIVSDDAKKIVVSTSPLTDAKEEVLKSDIQSERPSKVSPMPEGLVNTFSKDEILDLIAYLESGGKKTAAAFQK